MLRLYTFHISHFSEKARWALDYEGLPYEEKVLVPGPHRLTTLRRAPRSSVPLLEHDGRYVQGSSAILDYLGATLGATKLAPRGEDALRDAQAIEHQIDHAFGLGAQRVLYSVMLRDRAALTALWSADGPRWARLFYAVAYPGVAAVVARMYRTKDPAAVEQSKRAFVEAFDALDARLARQPYLVGETPSRADVSAAALLAPLCRPPQHRVAWPEVPEALRGFVSELEGRPTWQHVLRMYREHR